MVIHGTTFYILDKIADKFKLYVKQNSSIVVGTTGQPHVIPPKGEHTPIVVDRPTQTIFQNQQMKMNMEPSQSHRIDSNRRGRYQQLHETLDISVFR